MEYLAAIEKSLFLLGCAYLSWKIIRYIWGLAKIKKEPVKVLVSGAAGMLSSTLICDDYLLLSS